MRAMTSVRLKRALRRGMIAAVAVVVVQAASAASGSELWSVTYAGGSAADVAASPDGTKVFVTGSSASATTGADYATVAYDASTKAQLWVSRFSGPGNHYDAASSLAVSPAGTRVFVTGYARYSSTTGSDYVTLAYDAATGTKLWASRYNGTGSDFDGARSVAVSGDGTRVFVTGTSRGTESTRFDYATVAYDAATGAKLWGARYDGPAHGYDEAVALAVRGSRVYVTGTSRGTAATGYDYATVSYDATTGAQQWTARYTGPGSRTDVAADVAVSGDGTRVFATGGSEGGATTGLDYGTVAYAADTGAQAWVARYDGAASSGDHATALASTATGVVVTGWSFRTVTGDDYVTLAYDGATGAKRWSARYSGDAGGQDYPADVGVSGDGAKVFVTGSSQGGSTDADYGTVSYDGATGVQLWKARYAAPGNSQQTPSALAVGADTVFVTGTSYYGSVTGSDYATVAYAL